MRTLLVILYAATCGAQTCPAGYESGTATLAILLVDSNSNTVFSVTQSGVSSTLVGGSGYTDGTAASAKFSSPRTIAVSKDQKTAIVSDQVLYGKNYVLRRIDLSTRSVSTFAGHIYTLTDSSSANVDGVGTAATFYAITNIQFGPDGNTLYVYNSAFSLVRSITYPQAAVSTIIGNVNSPYGMTDGILGSGGAIYPGPARISPDGTYFLYANSDYCNVRKLNISTNRIQTVAGSVSGVAAVMYCGCADGVGTAATFNQPYLPVFAPDGQYAYVIDLGNKGIRRINMATFQVSFFIGGCTANVLGQDGIGAAVSAKFNDLAITEDGLLMFATQFGTSGIRKIVISTATVTTIDAARTVSSSYYLALYTIPPACTPCASGSFSLNGSTCSVCAIGSYCKNTSSQVACTPGALICNVYRLVKPQILDASIIYDPSIIFTPGSGVPTLLHTLPITTVDLHRRGQHLSQLPLVVP